jgi:hypothetical protein
MSKRIALIGNSGQIKKSQKRKSNFSLKYKLQTKWKESRKLKIK